MLARSSRGLARGPALPARSTRGPGSVRGRFGVGSRSVRDYFFLFFLFFLKYFSKILDISQNVLIFMKKSSPLLRPPHLGPNEREFVENSRHPETPARVTQGPICGLRPGSGESPGSGGSPGSPDEFARARTEFRICKIRCKKQYVGPSGDLGDCFLTLARQARGRKLTTSKKK